MEKSKQEEKDVKEVVVEKKYNQKAIWSLVLGIALIFILLNTSNNVKKFANTYAIFQDKNEDVLTASKIPVASLTEDDYWVNFENATGNFEQSASQKIKDSHRAQDLYDSDIQFFLKLYSEAIDNLDIMVVLLTENAGALKNKEQKLIALEITQDASNISKYHKHLFINYLETFDIQEKVLQSIINNNGDLNKAYYSDGIQTVIRDLSQLNSERGLIQESLEELNNKITDKYALLKGSVDL